MAQSIYSGINTYVIFGEETAFATPATPSGSSYVDKVTSFTATVTNNMIRSQGIGEGRNATASVNGVLDVSGSMEWQFTDPSFLQYCVIAVESGAGTAGDPYEIQEVDQIGYESTQCPTLTLEEGKDYGSNDDVVSYDGVAINSFTLNASLGEIVTCTADWVARTATSSTTVETYTAPTNRPFTFVDGSMTVGSDTVGELQSFSLTCANNVDTFRSMGSRLISQPIAGIRRYDFSITLKLDYNDAASTLSGLEARGIVFDGTTSSTSPADSAQNTAVAVSFDLVEGAGSGDRVVNFDFENCYFESYSEPVAVEDGAVEVTINGFALSGLTDGSNKVPVRWWTIA